MWVALKPYALLFHEVSRKRWMENRLHLKITRVQGSLDNSFDWGNNNVHWYTLTNLHFFWSNACTLTNRYLIIRGWGLIVGSRSLEENKTRALIFMALSTCISRVFPLRKTLGKQQKNEIIRHNSQRDSCYIPIINPVMFGEFLRIAFHFCSHLKSLTRPCYFWTKEIPWESEMISLLAKTSRLLFQTHPLRKTLFIQLLIHSQTYSFMLCPSSWRSASFFYQNCELNERDIVITRLS